MMSSVCFSGVGQRKIASVLLVLSLASIMLFIFVRSSKDAAESSGESGRIVHAVKTVIVKIDKELENLDENEELALSDSISFIVRKLAHFSIFALLGANACALMYSLAPKRPLFIYPVLFSAFYAFTDELHQYFVPGRSMELRDMLIDTAGAALGAAVIAIAYRLYKKSKRGKENADEALPR